MRTVEGGRERCPSLTPTSSVARRARTALALADAGKRTRHCSATVCRPRDGFERERMRHLCSISLILGARRCPEAAGFTSANATDRSRFLPGAVLSPQRQRGALDDSQGHVAPMRALAIASAWHWPTVARRWKTDEARPGLSTSSHGTSAQTLQVSPLLSIAPSSRTPRHLTTPRSSLCRLSLNALAEVVPRNIEFPSRGW